MFVYKYDAVDQSGNRLSGYIRSQSLELAYANLKVHSWKVISIKKSLFRQLFLLNPVSYQSLSLWCDSLLNLLTAGVNLNSAFNLVSESHKGFLSDITTDIKCLLNKGYCFSKAAGVYKFIFGDLFIGLIEVSENTGSLIKSIEYMKKHYTFLHDIKRKIMMALYYPLLITAIIIPIMLFFMIYLMPIFEQMITECSGQVPFITKLVCDFGRIIYGKAFLLCFGLIAFLFIFIYLKKKFEDQFFNIVLKIPVIGKLMHKFYLTVFFKVFSAMLGSGMNILKAFQISEKLMKGIFAKEIHEVKNQIELGKNIGLAMENKQFFSQTSLQLIKIAETTGNIAETSAHLSQLYDQQLNDDLERLKQTIQPLFITILGSLFLIIVFGGIIPLYTSISVIS